MDYWRDGSLKGIAYWIYDFQALIGVVLASVAAIATIYFIRKQINQTSIHREEELASLKTAAKIEAVWALIKLSGYNRKCLSYISESYVQKDVYKLAVGSLGNPPELDLSVIPLLSKLAANSSSEVSNKIQNYLAHLQIQNSRLQSLRDSLGERVKMPDGTVVHSTYTLEQALLDHYVLKYQTNRLLGYCRGDYENVPDLMTENEFKNEVINFPDVTFIAEMIDYLARLWPVGWWKIK